MAKIRFFKKTAILIFFLVLTILLSACTAKKESNNNTLRIAYMPNITHAQALIGIAEGQFRRELGDEIKIEWIQFNAGPAIIEAMLAGEVDLAYIGPGPAVNGFVKSQGAVQTIAGACTGGALLVSRSDLVVDDLQELSGRKVAIPQFGNTQDLLLRNLLREQGLKDAARGGDVQIYQAKNSDIKVLLDKGDIDFALVPEPWGSRLIHEVGANIVLDYGQIYDNGKYTTTVVIASKDFLDKNPKLVAKFLKAHVAVTQYINSDLEEAKKIVNGQLLKFTKVALPQEVIDGAFAKTRFTVDPEISSNNDYIKISRQVDYLKVDVDTSDLYRLETLNSILKSQGRPIIEKTS